MFQMENRTMGFRIMLKDPELSTSTVASLKEKYAYPTVIKDWTQINKNLFAF